MAVVVTHKEKGGRYILLGAGYGSYQSSRPSFLLDTAWPARDEGELPVVLVCDYSGQVGWVRSENIEVVSVDGLEPKEVLDEVAAEESE